MNPNVPFTGNGVGANTGNTNAPQLSSTTPQIANSRQEIQGNNPERMLPVNSSVPVGQIGSANAKMKTTSNKEKIYSLIVKHPEGISDKAIQKELQISNVYNYCRQLEKGGYIVRKSVQTSIFDKVTVNVPVTNRSAETKAEETVKPDKMWKLKLSAIRTLKNMDGNKILEEALDDYLKKILSPSEEKQQ